MDNENRVKRKKKRKFLQRTPKQVRRSGSDKDLNSETVSNAILTLLLLFFQHERKGRGFFSVRLSASVQQKEDQFQKKILC